MYLAIALAYHSYFMSRGNYIVSQSQCIATLQNSGELYSNNHAVNPILAVNALYRMQSYHDSGPGLPHPLLGACGALQVAGKKCYH